MASDRIVPLCFDCYSNRKQSEKGFIGRRGISEESPIYISAFGGKKALTTAELYCRRDSEKERFFETFFQMCRKYGVRCASADEKERRFIEEVTRVTYERERAVWLGLPLTDVRPSFVS